MIMVSTCGVFYSLQSASQLYENGMVGKNKQTWAHENVECFIPKSLSH